MRAFSEPLVIKAMRIKSQHNNITQMSNGLKLIY